MKRLLLRLAFSLIVVSSHVTANQVNYYVIAEQARPFQIEQQGQMHSGIVTDIVSAIFAESDYQVNYHTYPFKRMISILEEGAEPNWLTYGSPNWGKVQSENLSEEPIYTVKHVLVSSSEKPLEFKNMDTMHGRSIVLLLGFDYPNLTPFFENGSVNEMRVKDYNAAYRVISRTPGDTAFVEMESRVLYNLKRLNLPLENFQIQPFSSVIPDYSIYLAFSPQMQPETQNYINTRLVELKASGEIDEIIQKYQ
ncbi:MULTISPECIES: substrate-binding periplasmic protein [Vibrio]|jgi:polar amino acid transport system substrate-binding protein|uniref:ABC transporter substrate-binding protein n=1 Tax=Vibrio alginolyticus TaxID=663 RepID=A0A0L8CZC6_VIBAL|nr:MULTISPECIES: ABC transporter substrate-binding protein [Vibrio]MDW1807831.1 ABC transporter substrate-binding protein [Vibrio sp. Vb2362]MDW2297255.1 ABC transporter substrate-binding protein [Vibrio sp. 1404]NAW95706.1 transporter substrate-binding domain-containing protein [Vibrio sp. V42_P2S4T144]QIR91546.1 transporter substrate-binding domain-containing protein [Vibrio diabolicus]GAK16312.1 ABC-type amino acid transport [Vibrio sp. JCM 19053]